MTFAPHSNTDVHYNRLQGIEGPAIVRGTFQTRDSEAHFEYSDRPVGSAHGDTFAPEFQHVIYTADGTRLATVKKTVVYVVTDEDADGQPVVEKWSVKGHRAYDTEWVGVRAAH